jgi:hypothetical protein
MRLSNSARHVLLADGHTERDVVTDEHSGGVRREEERAFRD